MFRKKTLLTIAALFFCGLHSIAQKTIADQRRRISANVARAFHGTGDASGGLLSLAYDVPVGKKWVWRNGFDFTLANQTDYFTSSTPSFIPAKPLQLLTVGYQWSSLLLYQPKFLGGRMRFGGGSILRYQASSRPSDYTGYSSIAIGPGPYIYPMYVIHNIQPSVFSIGFRAVAEVDVLRLRKFSIGVMGFLQNDTNADVISGLGITIGRILTAK